MRLIFKKEIPINKLIDKNEIAIRWADQFIFHSDHLGRINKNSIIPPIWQTPDEMRVWIHNDEGKLRSRIISLLDDTKGNVQLEADDLESYSERIRNHLLWHRYIDEPKSPDFVWTLSKIGWLAKELGGHYPYQKYRKSEIKLITNQGLINSLLILATFLAAIMPFVAIWIFPLKVYNNNIVPQQVFRPDIRIDSVWLNQQIEGAIQKKLPNQIQPKSTR